MLCYWFNNQEIAGTQLVVDATVHVLALVVDQDTGTQNRANHCTYTLAVDLGTDTQIVRLGAV